MKAQFRWRDYTTPTKNVSFASFPQMHKILSQTRTITKEGSFQSGQENENGFYFFNIPQLCLKCHSVSLQKKS